MDRACKNCRFFIYAQSMCGKEEPYCERRRKWIGDTLLCSAWEMVNVPKPQTNADRIRSMSDDELAEWITELTDCAVYPYTRKDAPRISIGQTCAASWLDWLKEEAKDD